MSVLYVAMPVAFVLAGLALWAFVRCARSGQYDDLDTPPLRMLADDDAPPSGNQAELIRLEPRTWDRVLSVDRR